MQRERTIFQGVMESDTAVDMVNHPPHYKALGVTCSMCQHPVECIDVTRHMNFNLGNAVKYIWRSKYKREELQDLHKAIFYLQNEINRINSSENNVKE